MTLTGLGLVSGTVTQWGGQGLTTPEGVVIANVIGFASINVGSYQLISSVQLAQMAIDAVNSAVNMVSDARASLGIQQRRLGHIINDLKAEDINVSAAKSRIWDADMATEISEFTRLQILQQSGTAILAQANAQPQSVLQLLK
jgi:flagellin